MTQNDGQRQTLERMDDSEAGILARLKNTLQDVEQYALNTETIEEFKQRLRNLIAYLEHLEQKRSG